MSRAAKSIKAPILCQSELYCGCAADAEASIKTSKNIGDAHTCIKIIQDHPKEMNPVFSEAAAGPTAISPLRQKGRPLMTLAGVQRLVGRSYKYSCKPPLGVGQ